MRAVVSDRATAVLLEPRHATTVGQGQAFGWIDRALPASAERLSELVAQYLSMSGSAPRSRYHPASP